MTNITSPIWPNEEQTLLLKASILQEHEALEAWNLFTQHQSDPHSSADKTQWSFIYYNLCIRQRIKTFQEKDILKKTYLTTYAKNRYLWQAVQTPLTQLLESKIPALIIKGFAYQALYYKDMGARESKDLDILVPESYFHQAALLLESLGWKTFQCRPLRSYNPRITHALAYFDEHGHCIDLHCHLLKSNTDESANEDYWCEAQTIVFENQIIKTLSDTDHLMHVCVDAFFTSSVRWITDAMCILSHAHIDWDRLVKTAEKRAISLFLSQTLTYLRTYFSAHIPEETLVRLDSIHVSILDRRMYHLTQLRTQDRLSSHQYLFYNMYRNNRKKTMLYCLGEYLKSLCSTHSLLLVPVKIPIIVLKKMIHYIRD